MIRNVSMNLSSSSSNNHNHNNSEKLNRKLKLNTKTKKKKRSPVFPQRLYEMLEDAEQEGYAHLIRWSPDGMSFHLSYDTQNNSTNKAFVQVLTRRFNQTHFKSFLRQLQLYGFERQFKGSRKGECKHPLFQRHHKDLLFGKSIEEYQDATTHNTTILANRMMMCTNQQQKQQQQQQQQSVLLSSTQDVDTNSIPPPLPLYRHVTTNEPTTTTICTSTSKCNYRSSSTIPTTLTNLVFPDDEDDDDDNDAADVDDDEDTTTESNGSDNNSLGSNTVFNRTFFRPSICSNTCDNYEYACDCDDDNVDMRDENMMSVDDHNSNNNSNYDVPQWIGSSIYRI